MIRKLVQLLGAALGACIQCGVSRSDRSCSLSPDRVMFVGIDVAKDPLVVAVRSTGALDTVVNSAAGLQPLLRT